MMARPLVRKAFELAERLGGMTAFELMGRMTVREMNWWVEHDNTNISKADYHYAAMMCQLEGIRGVAKTDPKKWLPKVKRPRKTLASIKNNFDMMAAFCVGARAKKSPAPPRPPDTPGG